MRTTIIALAALCFAGTAAADEICSTKVAGEPKAGQKLGADEYAVVTYLIDQNTMTSNVQGGLQPITVTIHWGPGSTVTHRFPQTTSPAVRTGPYMMLSGVLFRNQCAKLPASAAPPASASPTSAEAVPAK